MIRLLPLAALAVCAWATPAHAVLFVEDRLLAEDLGSGGGGGASEEVPPWKLPPRRNAPDAVEEADLPPFDATPVTLTSKRRIEAHAALWMIEQAGRQRTTQPALGVGVSGMATERIRWDVGALFAVGQVGTPAFHVLSLYPAIHARAHYGWAFGGTWLFVGAGPSLTAIASFTTIEDENTDASFTIAGGPELAVGVQTEVDGRLVRFEIAAASRGIRALRIDGRAGLSVGF